MSAKQEANGVSPKEEFFQPLNADDNEVTEIPSMCVSCFEQGLTKLMLTKIPFFKDVIIASFSCSQCGFTNSELSSAMEISAVGVEFTLQVKNKSDLNRMVVKTDYAALNIPELELETPQRTQKGEVTTVEGILTRVMTGLQQDQERRKEEHPEIYEQIEKYLKKMEDALALKTPFTLKIRDISGNSFIGGPPDILSIVDDPQLTSRKFERSKSENEELGLPDLPPVTEEDAEDGFKDEVLQIPTNCPECNEPCFTKMKVTDIPFFKEVIIMATDCDKCGCKSNEVKSGGGIEPKGKRMKLRVKSREDFSRDVLKSETCGIEIPELQLEAGSHVFAGKFTTVEGLLSDIKKNLFEDNPIISGDSVDPEFRNKVETFCAELDRLLTGEHEFTLVLDDPAGNCYIQNVYAPEEDPELETELYERTFEQNEELGLNDMNVGPQETS
ncbi:Zinc finger protein-likeZPR1 [Orchesella cincta]|uniref:Zinc finger protein-likeZPR1 n=1 Tax=Orchesella cincta TaxID=48709 RepID=A0A1D2M8K6_ORCCI|nr:Zinc finger protein-likeZPR1 [Orchesella cincta]